VLSQDYCKEPTFGAWHRDTSFEASKVFYVPVLHRYYPQQDR
jgi:hypothetical protein